MTNHGPNKITTKLPPHLQRQELQQVKDVLGIEYSKPWDLVDLFEDKIAKFAGAKYAVSTDSCTSALRLSLEYLKFIRYVRWGSTITIPDHTYLSIPMLISQAGCTPHMTEYSWTGAYSLRVKDDYSNALYMIDSASRFRRDMYESNTLHCLSFQFRKRLPIGKGGMILTDNPQAYTWLKAAAYDGRDRNIVPWSSGRVDLPGWHVYMTPEDAARGLLIFDWLLSENSLGDFEDSYGWRDYPSLVQMGFTRVLENDFNIL